MMLILLCCKRKVSLSTLGRFSALSIHYLRLALIDLTRTYRRDVPILFTISRLKLYLWNNCCQGVTRLSGNKCPYWTRSYFLGTRKRSRLLREAIKPLYRVTFKARRSRLVFQNADDQEKLIQLGITDEHRVSLIRGSGVDIDCFSPHSDTSGRFQDPLQVLFPSRLIREKGTTELLFACKRLWSDGYKLELLIAGALDTGNRWLFPPQSLLSFAMTHASTF